jgi:hypothetical protein
VKRWRVENEDEELELERASLYDSGGEVLEGGGRRRERMRRAFDDDAYPG